MRGSSAPSVRQSEGDGVGPPSDTNRRRESSLPPVDGGKQAWFFLAACFFVEALTWGTRHRCPFPPALPSPLPSFLCNLCNFFSFLGCKGGLTMDGNDC